MPPATTARRRRSTLGTSASFLPLALLLGLTLVVWGCNDLTGSPGLPAGTPNPAFYNNATGALGMRNAAIFEVESALPQYIIDTGLLSDELEDANTGASQGALLQNGGAVNDPLDERILPVGTTGGGTSYGDLQGIREFANQAIGALATYDTAAATLDSAKVMRGELYALEGYAEIMLADLFCSGVPLSTLDFQKDFTYAPSSSWQQVYQDALGKLDSALTLASASDSVVHLARVLQGRAYLDLGQYATAADDVTAVPDGFQYQLVLNWTDIENIGPDLLNATATMSDHEGLNGLPFLSSGDPRSAALGVAVKQTTGVELDFPAKYSAALTGGGYAPVTLASGVEARLIQAEAALQKGDAATWLADLNALRTTGNYTVTPDPTIPTQLDTVWQAGSGGVSGLPPITDPVAPAARVDTSFTERAYWLYLTGHRQGDLRRLLRQYSQYAAFQSQAQVYPTGPYLAPGTGVYGTDVTVPIPNSEDANPDFHGCLSRNP